MILQHHTQDSDNFTAVIIPIAEKTIPPIYLTSYPELRYLPVPDKEEWASTISNSKLIILLRFDDKANQRKICDTFRHFAVKAKSMLGEKPLMLMAHVDETAAEPAMRGFAMSDYQLGMYKGEQRRNINQKASVLYVGGVDEKSSAEAQTRAEVQMRAMKLVDTPASEKIPATLGDWAVDSARAYNYSCEVWDVEKLSNFGMHAIQAVGKGSMNPPIFIISRYKGAKTRKSVDIALVGKGVTFDTGGISIKPSENLHYMKCDMAGAAAMLGAIELAARMELPLNITAVVPAAENSVDARSLLPGDVIHSYSGKTIEVLNTDAEGRLILADALAWTVKHEKPDCIVDMATLTGAAVRALGPEAAALYTNNQKLEKALMEAGYKTGEKLWPMPLWDDYDKYLHSDIADMSNLPQSPAAGTIAAAKFLQQFTNNHDSWAHIDMAGPSFTDSPFSKMKAASGYGVQLLYELLVKWA